MSPVVALKRRIEDLILAPEPGKQWNARQRRCTAKKRRVRDLEFVSQTAEAAHVDDVAHRVHDTAGCEEEKSLKECMREEMEDAAGDGAAAQTEKHVAKLAHGR